MALFDLEAYPEEAERVVSLYWLFRVCRGYGIGPAEISRDAASGPGGRTGTPEELAQAVEKPAARKGKSPGEPEDERDLDLEPHVRDPTLYFEWGGQHLRSVCAVVGWDWLGCLDLWFDRWQAAQGARGPKPDPQEESVT